MEGRPSLTAYGFSRYRQHQPAAVIHGRLVETGDITAEGEMFKILAHPPPPPPPRGEELVAFPFVLGSVRTVDGGGESTGSSLSLLNLTRRAASGTFCSIFKLTIYNQFSKGGGARAGAGGWEVIVQQRVVRGVSR